jgi:hypothetical protein
LPHVKNVCSTRLEAVTSEVVFIYTEQQEVRLLLVGFGKAVFCSSIFEHLFFATAARSHPELTRFEAD